ncbi:hypothetical protein BC835DRAFT_99016 [Cytidiella melzeri]|nr:hypothetical protein BC835DRAFT_99016 [Cytidiella melzeri]
MARTKSEHKKVVHDASLMSTASPSTPRSARAKPASRPLRQRQSLRTGSSLQQSKMASPPLASSRPPRKRQRVSSPTASSSPQPAKRVSSASSIPEAPALTFDRQCGIVMKGCRDRWGLVTKKIATSNGSEGDCEEEEEEEKSSRYQPRIPTQNLSPEPVLTAHGDLESEDELVSWDPELFASWDPEVLTTVRPTAGTEDYESEDELATCEPDDSTPTSWTPRPPPNERLNARTSLKSPRTSHSSNHSASNNIKRSKSRSRTVGQARSR